MILPAVYPRSSAPGCPPRATSRQPAQKNQRELKRLIHVCLGARLRTQIRRRANSEEFPFCGSQLFGRNHRLLDGANATRDSLGSLSQSYRTTLQQALINCGDLRWAPSMHSDQARGRRRSHFGFTRSNRSMTSSLVMRMQPDDMAWPIYSGWLVPWMRYRGSLVASEKES